MAKLSKKKRDALITAAFNRHCSGIQIPIMKIGAIWKVGEAALDAGGELEQIGAAMREACEQVAHG